MAVFLIVLGLYFGPMSSDYWFWRNLLRTLEFPPTIILFQRFDFSLTVLSQHIFRFSIQDWELTFSLYFSLVGSEDFLSTNIYYIKLKTRVFQNIQHIIYSTFNFKRTVNKLLSLFETSPGISIAYHSKSSW